MRSAATVVVLRDSPGGAEALLVRRSPHSRTFPGAWVFPGGAVEPGDGPDPDGLRRAGVRELREETTLTLTPDALRPWSCWIPPAEAPVQVRTWFFLAVAPAHPVTVDGGEVVDHAWLTPARALDEHARGLRGLMPPTWLSLHDLRGLRSVDDAFAGIAVEPPTYRTTVTNTATSTELSWGPPRSARLRIDRLPWELLPAATAQGREETHPS